jgi:hypothetical protein
VRDPGQAADEHEVDPGVNERFEERARVVAINVGHAETS